MHDRAIALVVNVVKILQVVHMDCLNRKVRKLRKGTYLAECSNSRCLRHRFLVLHEIELQDHQILDAWRSHLLAVVVVAEREVLS